MKLRFRGLLGEIIILFACGTLMIGMFTYFSQQVITDANVKKQTQTIASHVANESIQAIKEYPAYEWLIGYWRDHADELDIEYDVDYSTGTETEKKVRLLNERHPDLQLKYATAEEILALPPEDQKLYAEVAYSWLVTRYDQIKSARKVSFLFCVLTDDKFDSQFFIISAAAPGEVRGTTYGQIYTLGVTSDVGDSQIKGMQDAYHNDSFLAAAGVYVDYYQYMETIDDQHLMIGLTYDVSEINKDAYRQAKHGTLFAMFLELLMAFICLILIRQVVLKPLNGIQENIRLYMQNKDSAEVNKNLAEIQPSNEIGQLSRDISDMTAEIDNHLERITEFASAEEKIKTELALAWNIQDSMLPGENPELAERTEFEVFATMTPARDIGGDFYNYFLIDEDHLCVLIADVAGKGIPAAMFMMASQIILKDNAVNETSPSEIMRRANELICANNRQDMFVTVWLGILEISTGKMKASNAGHEYPAIRRQGGTFELFKDPHSCMVGGMEGLKYKEYELQLNEGDWLFTYTDGVPEATNAEMKMFGTDRMIEALNEAADTPEEVLKNVRNAVDDFAAGAEQFDDLTMLCLKYNGNQ